MKTPKRKIPSTMASQHPDHANIPYFLKQPFISTADETREAFLNFSELGISEYKWDWEGKLVDESVVERLLSEYFDYFKRNPLGKKKFLTFRLPNPWVETEFRFGRSLMNLISGAAMATTFKLPEDTPLFEVILPMTTNAKEMIAINEAFIELSLLKHELFRMHQIPLKSIKVIPLFEDIWTIIDSDKILKEYLRLFRKKFKRQPDYLRPYMARSDPALNAGFIPTVLAVKIALSRYRKFESENNFKLYPIIGSASLPFRGGLTPLNVSDFVSEYAGIRTALIQSAFRYDYPKKDVIDGIKKLEKLLPKKKARLIDTKEERELIRIIKIFEDLYKPTVEKLAPLINQVASFMPKRRERVQHTGLFGYSRGIGKVKLPRAIGFTASLYSLGMPPELISTGRAVARLKIKDQRLKILEKNYINLKKDLIRTGGFVNKEVVKKLALKNKGAREYLEDLEGVENYLGVELGPKTEEEKKHQEISNNIFKYLNSGKNLTKLISDQAILRKSLG